MTRLDVSEQLIHRLRLEHLAAQVLALFDGSGVDALLLKGPVTNTWLYGGADSRTFRDIDVLVRPAHYAAAQVLLRCAGFVDLHARLLPVHRPAHERAWQREGLLLDVHTRLAGIPAAHQDLAFSQLWGDRQAFALQGRIVSVLAEPARTVHLALHAAQSHEDGRALRDLEQGLKELTPQVWASALSLATSLKCTGAVAAGLQKSSSGAAVARGLGPSARPTTEVLLRAHGASMEAQNLWEAASTRPAKSAVRELYRLVRPPTEVHVGLRTCASATGRTGWALTEIARAAVRARSCAWSRPQEPAST